MNGTYRSDQYPGVSNVSGDGNRVMRGTITSTYNPRRATSVTAVFNNVYSGGGTIVCQISAGANDFINATGAQGSSTGRATAYVSGSGNKTVTFTFATPITLEANTTYYLWFYPNETNQGCALKIASAFSGTGATVYGDQMYMIWGYSDDPDNWHSTVSGGGAYIYGSTCTLTVNPVVPTGYMASAYQWRRWTGYVWEDVSGQTGTTYSFTVDSEQTYGCYVTITQAMYYLDLNGYVDGVEVGGIGACGVCDVYINGSLVASGVDDYWVQHPYGTTYEIRNIVPAAGKQYLGVYFGTLTGTITADTYVALSFGSQPVVSRGAVVLNGTNGYYVYVYITDPGGTGINRVQFPTWTTYNGQDDLVYDWPTNPACTGTVGSWTIDGNAYNYRYTVNRSDHNNEFGEYNTHVYPYANTGAYNSWGCIANLIQGAARIYSGNTAHTGLVYIYHDGGYHRYAPYVYHNGSYRAGS